MAYTDSVTLQSSKIEVPKTNAPADSSATSQVDGQAVYTAACSSCHGTEGNNGLADAKDLTTSKLSSEEIKNQIIQGKNVMPSFEGKLTNEEIDAVVKYTEGLRK
jgi:mono/diheme cytochrome c family protein